MKSNTKALKVAAASALSVALIASSAPAAMAADEASSDAAGGAGQGLAAAGYYVGYAIAGVVGLAINYAFWGTVYNFARSQNWINNVPVAPGLPNFDRP